MDNPQAFPTGGETKDCGVCGTGVYVPAPGMTLLDYFAGRALVGMLTSPHNDDATPEMYASASYAIARAMLTARQENSNGH